MQRMMVLTAVLAVAMLSQTHELQAASPFAPGLQAGEGLVVQAQAKGKGPGKCGVGKYWDRKKRDCVSK